MAVELPLATVPSVSIVIPCWNAERWIARAIQSALDQDHPNLEVIVIDDGSTDGSLEVIKSFGDKIRWQTGPNDGACAARNRGLQRSTAEYLCFLDADDFFFAPHIRPLAAQTAGKPDMVIACQRVTMRRGVIRKTVLPFDVNFQSNDFIRDWLSGSGAQTASVLWKRSFLQKIRAWNEAMPRLQDVELPIRAFLANPCICLSEQSGVAIFVHDGPWRVSSRHDRETQGTLYNYFVDLSQEIVCLPRDVKLGLGMRCYRLAGDAYRYDFTDLGDAFMRLAKAHGVTRHAGTLAHRLVSSIIGYRRKELLVKYTRRFIARLLPSGLGDRLHRVRRPSCFGW